MKQSEYLAGSHIDESGRWQVCVKVTDEKLWRAIKGDVEVRRSWFRRVLDWVMRRGPVLRWGESFRWLE